MTAFAHKALLGCVREPSHPLTVGLLNNASGRALKASERHFVSLLRAATVRSGLHIRFYTCTNLDRAEWPVASTGEAYSPIDELLSAGPDARPVDAMVVTGMVPQAADLREEPIWSELAAVADWAEERAMPVLWSCLAAHAAVLQITGIRRQRFDRKLSGVYRCHRAPGGTVLAGGLPQSWLMPHSRYNGVPEAALVASGYEILSHSEETGPDIFVRRSTAVSMFCQGHPEYDADTLLLEYRRDICRFFAGTSDEYPNIPCHYLDPALEDSLIGLRARAARVGPDPSLLSDILAILDRAAGARGAVWRGSAVHLCAAWLTAAVPVDGLPFGLGPAASVAASGRPPLPAQAALVDGR